MILNRLQALVLSLTALSFLMMTGCTDSDKPDNLEPVIEILPATDITRSEAVVSGRVHKRGTTGLTSLAFYYAPEAGSGAYDFVPVEVSGAETVSTLLTNLKPGTTYSCYLQGRTSTATLRSETITFSTQPNELPTLTRAEALSTGPTGIIVEFEITDDGGEALLGAGCEVADVSNGLSWRVNIVADGLTVGKHRLVLGNLTPLTQFTITPFAANSIGEATGPAIDFTTQNSIILKEAGALASVFEGTAVVSLRRLLISGYMNGDDFRFLRMLLGTPTLGGVPEIESSVSEIDLTDVRIVEGGGSYDGARFTDNDKVTTGLLADCPSLRVALLPSSATVLARDAVARCEALGELTIPAAVETLLPSAGCPSLRAIDVSAANINFAAVDGVVFNHQVRDIVWFPQGKTGGYTLPSTVTKISENAFMGTQISSLVIPPSVKTIARGAFAGSALTEITLPDNLANVSEGMFQGCASLATVRLGTGTTYVGNYAFDGTALTHLYVGATEPPFAAGEAFFNRSLAMTEVCVLHVPSGSIKKYRNNSKWGLFDHIEEF